MIGQNDKDPEKQLVGIIKFGENPCIDETEKNACMMAEVSLTTLWKFRQAAKLLRSTNPRGPVLGGYFQLHAPHATQRYDLRPNWFVYPKL